MNPRFSTQIIVSILTISLSACGDNLTTEPGGEVAQNTSALSTCGEFALGIASNIEPLFPDQTIPPWSKLSGYPAIIQWSTGQSALRDGICGASTPADCVKVRLDNNQYYITLTNVNSTSQCGAFYARLQDFLNQGVLAAPGVYMCMITPGCWNNFTSSNTTKTPWQMWLPLGMSITNNLGGMVLHYPPIACWLKKDYIDPGDPTVKSWNRKLDANGVTSLADQQRYNAWMDVDPVMADGLGVNMPTPITYFNNTSIMVPPSQLYITNMLNWLVSPPSNQNVNFQMPLLITGGYYPATTPASSSQDPHLVIREIIRQRAGTGSYADGWSVVPQPVNSLDFFVNSVGVTTTTTGYQGKKIAMMAANHPDVAILSNCVPSAFPDPMTTEKQDMAAICWWKAMSEAIRSNPTANPDPVAIANACTARWLANPLAPADQHQLCKLAVRDYTPIKVTGVSGGKVSAHIAQRDFRCADDVSADKLCNTLHDDPCSGFQPVVNWSNIDCTNLSATSEVACADGIDNDGDGKVDCVDPDCDNAANCDAGDGTCCLAQAGRGCSDEAGENFVCACDPYCCNTQWDSTCATEYYTAANVHPPGGACALGFGGVCNETSCADGIDNTIPSDGKVDCADKGCALQPICRPFGGAQEDCCAAHASPGCENALGRYYVCNELGLTSCCTGSWSSTCVNAYKSGPSFSCTERRGPLSCRNGVDDDGNGLADAADNFCKDVPDGFPAVSCCGANTVPNCGNALAAADVCAFDPFCCKAVWDSQCASEFRALPQYDLDGDGLADECELTSTSDFAVWGHTFDYRSDKSTGGTDSTLPFTTGEAGGTVKMTKDGTTAGYGSVLIRAKTQVTNINPFAVYFQYRTNNTTGTLGHGLSFFWDKNGGAMAAAPAPSGDALGLLQDNTGFAVLLNPKLGLIRVMGGTSILTSVAAADLATSSSWKQVGIKVGANSVQVHTWNGTTWVLRLSYTHPSNWNSDSRGFAGDHVGFGAGTSSSDAAEISLRNVSFSESARAFVSSVAYDGGLGGLGGADEKCTRLATSAGLGGRWKAWLSTGAQNPASRFARSLMPYKLVNGVQVATDWADLLDGVLTAAINVTELNSAANSYSWSATDVNGATIGCTDCSGWTSNLSSATGCQGNNLSTNSGWTVGWYNTCNSPARIYCFEQPY